MLTESCHILMVTHVLPYPPSAGNEIRILQMLRWLANKGYRISLVIKPMGIPEVSNESVTYLSSLVETLYLFDSRVSSESIHEVKVPTDEVTIDVRLADIQDMFCPTWFSSEVGRIIDNVKPDVVLSEYALMGRALVSSQYTGFLKIIDTHDVFSQLKESLSQQGVSESGGLYLTVAEETFLLQRADVVLAIQKTEKSLLEKLVPDCDVLVTPMDLDIPEASHTDQVLGRVLIVGSDNAYNVEGAKHFIEVVWPLVKSDCPDATLHVVGKLSARLQTDDLSIRLLGYVDSISDEYLAASVVVNPCLHGTGLKIKTIEALSWSKAHVGWPVSADGIRELGTLPYVVAQDELSFAQAVLDFLEDDSLRADHEAKSYEFALGHFSPDAVYGPLSDRIAAHMKGAQSVGLNVQPLHLPKNKVFCYTSELICGEGTEYRVHIFLMCEDDFASSDCGPQNTLGSVCLESLDAVNNKLSDLLASGKDVFLFAPQGVSLSTQDIQTLAQVLQQDSLFGFVMPRLSEIGERNLVTRMSVHCPTSERRLVAGAPVLVRASIFRDFGLLDAAAPNLDSALAKLFVRANRRGFSARLVNTVVVESPKKKVSKSDLTLTQASDYTKALAAQSALPEVRFERLLRHFFGNKEKRDVLVDIRNLAPGFNGTAHHVLALMGPLVQLATKRGIKIYFWVLPESADFHGLREIYGDAVIHQLAPDQCFDASIRLTQPWSLTEVRDLAYASPVNVFSVLDTIAWDCHYIRMPHLEGVWRAMAGFADGLVYISDFSKRAFNVRFPESSGALNAVAHCSMDPTEYWSAKLRDSLECSSRVNNPYVLIVGNRYYHKGLAEVVPVLSAAFPKLHFKVLGDCNGTFHNVEQLSSGAQPAADIAALFAGCDCLVFPSFYEGFGLPIFEALAFGKTVLARQSELIEELREHIAPVSGLIPFSSNSELLTGIQQAVEASAVSGQFQTTIFPAKPYRWENSAAEILNSLEALIEKEDFSRCRERLEFFYRVELFDVERSGWADSTQNKVSFEVEKEE